MRVRGRKLVLVVLDLVMTLGLFSAIVYLPTYRGVFGALIYLWGYYAGRSWTRAALEDALGLKRDWGVSEADIAQRSYHQ